MTAVATRSTSRGSTGPEHAPSRSDWPESISISRTNTSKASSTPAGEADRLREEIAERLTALIDPENRASAVKRVYIASKFYKGPYRENGPDLIVGYQRGYRVSWETAIGRTTKDVFHDNTKAWSGDHCVDPSLVPGILFCNRFVENENPRLIDIGPTVLSMFGATVPDYMDGKALTVADAGAKTPSEREETLAQVV